MGGGDADARELWLIRSAWCHAGTGLRQRKPYEVYAGSLTTPHHRTVGATEQAHVRKSSVGFMYIRGTRDFYPCPECRDMCLLCFMCLLLRSNRRSSHYISSDLFQLINWLKPSFLSRFMRPGVFSCSLYDQGVLVHLKWEMIMCAIMNSSRFRVTNLVNNIGRGSSSLLAGYV
jgi:hypothetical protein